jgi:hypothetical protein
MTPEQKARHKAVLDSARAILRHWTTNDGTGYPDPRADLPPELEPAADRLAEYSGDEMLTALFLNKHLLSGYFR